MKRWMIMGLTLALGCGGAGAGEDTGEGAEATAGGEAQSAQAGGEQLAWADMNMEQRAHYMHDVVVPAMDPLFRPYHPDFGCQTCHGENAQEVHFHMPNTVAPLDPNHMPFESEDEQTRQTAQFMAEQVETRMAELLGMEPYNMETHEGFGCFGCHAMAQGADAAPAADAPDAK